MLVHAEARGWPALLWMEDCIRPGRAQRGRAARSTRGLGGDNLGETDKPQAPQSGEHDALISTWGHTGNLPTRAGISPHGHGVTVHLWRDLNAAARGHVWAEDTCTLVCWRPAPCRPGNTRGLSPSGRGRQAPERPAQSYDVIETNVFTAGRSPVTVQWRPRKKASRACQDFRAGPSLARKKTRLSQRHILPMQS